jgi:hypothetical protein
VRAARRPLVLAMLAAAAAAGFAETSLEAVVSSDDLREPAAAVSASLAIDEEHLFGDVSALQWDLEAAASIAPRDGSVSASGSVWLEASRMLPRTVVTGWLSGNASGSSVDGNGPVSGSLGASLVFNGETAGCSLEPWVGIQAFVDPFLEAGLSVRATLLAGSWVLEPVLAAGPRWDADAGLLARLEPGLDVAWYPGVPLSIEAGLRWEASLAATGAVDAEWVGKLSVSGALGGVVLFESDGTLRWGAGGVSGEARTELSILLATVAGSEFSIPFRLLVSGSDAGGLAVGVGAGLRLSW